MANFTISRSEITIHSNVLNHHRFKPEADLSVKHEHDKMFMNINFEPFLGSSINHFEFSSNENRSNDFISHDITINNLPETASPSFANQIKSVEFNLEELNQIWADLDQNFPSVLEQNTQVVLENRDSPLLNQSR
jgi:hypothetical protein